MSCSKLRRNIHEGIDRDEIERERTMMRVRCGIGAEDIPLCSQTFFLLGITAVRGEKAKWTAKRMKEVEGRPVRTRAVRVGTIDVSEDDW